MISFKNCKAIIFCREEDPSLINLLPKNSEIVWKYWLSLEPDILMNMVILPNCYLIDNGTYCIVNRENIENYDYYKRFTRKDYRGYKRFEGITEFLKYIKIL